MLELPGIGDGVPHFTARASRWVQSPRPGCRAKTRMYSAWGSGHTEVGLRCQAPSMHWRQLRGGNLLPDTARRASWHTHGGRLP